MHVDLQVHPTPSVSHGNDVSDRQKSRACGSLFYRSLQVRLAQSVSFDKEVASDAVIIMHYAQNLGNDVDSDRHSPCISLASTTRTNNALPFS